MGNDEIRPLCAQFVHQPDHVWAIKDFAEKQYCARLRSGQFVLHFGKLGVDVFGIRQGGEYRCGFDPCGFMRLLGFEADGGEDVVEKRADVAAKQRTVQAVFGGRTNADHHDFRRPDGYVKTGQIV